MCCTLRERNKTLRTSGLNLTIKHILTLVAQYITLLKPILILYFETGVSRIIPPSSSLTYKYVSSRSSAQFRRLRLGARADNRRGGGGRLYPFNATLSVAAGGTACCETPTLSSSPPVRTTWTTKGLSINTEIFGIANVGMCFCCKF